MYNLKVISSVHVTGIILYNITIRLDCGCLCAYETKFVLPIKNYNDYFIPDIFIHIFILKFPKNVYVVASTRDKSRTLASSTTSFRENESKDGGVERIFTQNGFSLTNTWNKETSEGSRKG